MFVDLDWPTNASSPLSASAELLVNRATQRVSAVFAVEWWLDGWMSVTRRYCVWTAKPILKLFRPYGSPIIIVFFRPLCRYQIPRRSPSVRVLNTRRWEKLAIFYWNRRLSWKRYKIGAWVLWNVNRKSVADQSVSVLMTLNDLWPGFQGHDIFRSQISQKQSYYRTPIGNYTQSIEWYYF